MVRVFESAAIKISPNYFVRTGTSRCVTFLWRFQQNPPSLPPPSVPICSAVSPLTTASTFWQQTTWDLIGTVLPVVEGSRLEGRRTRGIRVLFCHINASNGPHLPPSSPPHLPMVRARVAVVWRRSGSCACKPRREVGC